MTFWLFAAGLTLLALACVLWPLFKSGRAPQAEILTPHIYRQKQAELAAERALGSLDGPGHDVAQRELDAQLLQDCPVAAPLPDQLALPKGRLARVGLPLALLLLLPGLTYGLYRHLGAPAVLESKALEDARNRHDADGMLKALEDNLSSHPEDGEAWYVLGRAYLSLQRHQDAEKALAQATRIAPTDARYLAQYAEALGMADKGNLQGRVLALVDKALSLNPDEEKALELAGLAAYQRQDLNQAILYWRHLLKRLPAASEYHQDIQKAVDAAEAELGMDARFSAQPGTKPSGTPTRRANN